VRDGQRHDRGTHRANPLGALLAVLGVAGFCVSIFLNWIGAGSRTGVVDAGPGEQTLNGYDLTPVLPFVALLGAGLAAVGLAVCYLIDPPGLGGAANNVTTKIGIFVALASAAVWSIGAGCSPTRPRATITRGTTTPPVPGRSPDTPPPRARGWHLGSCADRRVAPRCGEQPSRAFEPSSRRRRHVEGVMSTKRL